MASEDIAAGNTILVSVNGVTLTQDQAQQMMQENLQRQGVPPQMLDQVLQQMGDQLENQIVEQFIALTLLEQEIDRLAQPVPDADVDRILNQMISTLPEGVNLEEALAAQNMTVEDLKESIVSSERMRALYESKTASIPPASPEQIASYYDENRDQFVTEENVTASHVLIACDENADAATHESASSRADTLRTELLEGAVFAEVASQHSSCPSKENGGDLGTFSRGQMVPEFETAAFSQDVGSVGEVVKTKFGYHVILVTAHDEGGTRPLEAVQNEIGAQLDNQARQTVFDAYINTLREGAEITRPGVAVN